MTSLTLTLMLGEPVGNGVIVGMNRRQWLKSISETIAKARSYAIGRMLLSKENNTSC